MFFEIFREAGAALGRHPVRSLLTMTGIAWGIVAVTLLLSYGAGFRGVLMYTFEVFGTGAVVCWPPSLILSKPFATNEADGAPLFRSVLTPECCVG